MSMTKSDIATRKYFVSFNTELLRLDQVITYFFLLTFNYKQATVRAEVHTD